MSSSTRIEVLENLHTLVKENGTIALSRQDRIKAFHELEVGRQQNEENRRKVLLHELARFYRVVIFGSARLGKNSQEFRFVTKLAQSLVEARDVDIVTGGGPGIMEAGNLGVRLALKNPVRSRRLRARSLGVTISTLPHEAGPNSHLHFETKHREFPTRLQTFLDKTDAAFFAPGGIGTLLEMAFVLQTKQVGHIEASYPLIAHPFWEPVVEAWNNQLYYLRLAQGNTPLISQEDLQLISFTDKIPDIVNIVSQSYDIWDQSIRKYVKILP